MDLHPFTPNYLPAAVELFAANFRRLRQDVPALPATLEDEARSSASCAAWWRPSLGW